MIIRPIQSDLQIFILVYYN